MARQGVVVRGFVLFAATLSALLLMWGAGCATSDDAQGPDLVEAAPLLDAAGADTAPQDGGAVGDSTTGDAPAVDTFNVASAASAGNAVITVTFDAPPDPAQAAVLGNYSVPGLTLSGTPSLAGNVVTLVTSPQTVKAYTLSVSGVARASDKKALGVASAMFQGIGTFNVKAAASTKTTTLTVTFDSPPKAAEATNLANYDVPGLTLSAPQLVGSTVALTTTAQAAQPYTLTVSAVTRAIDGATLDMRTAGFMGRAPFDVQSAASANSVTMTVTFDAPPNAAQATTRTNYNVPGLVLSGTPTLSGNTVTIKTSGQLGQTYSVTVSNVTRAADTEPLLLKAADFAGTAVLAPTVTNVEVTASNPNNGTIPYNTGTSTLKITGTDLATVDCAGLVKGVTLDDLDAADAAARTKATACTVDSDTQITAMFPAGIRTNGPTGWNVIVTNIVASNAASGVAFIPVAGLLISEIYTGIVGNADHEFVEIYNPTALPITTTGAAGIGLNLWVRNSSGTPSHKPITLLAGKTGIIPSHSFLLVVSSASDANDAWYASRDFTFTAALIGNGAAYISLNATAATPNLKVIDRVGWGTQPAPGYEGTATLNVPSGVSIERKPAAGAGHATDTDVNLTDFNPPSPVLTPRGTADGAQP